MKYVTLFSEREQTTIIVACLQPLSHADLARAFAPMGYRPASAGFLAFHPARGLTTHGSSDSLGGLKPAPFDAPMIAKLHQLSLASLPELNYPAAAPAPFPPKA